MTTAKELLEQATPLPWVMQEPGENDPGAGTVFIDTHAYENGPEPVIAESAPLGREDALLIVYAVNRLPDYEAAVEALDDMVANFDAAVWSQNLSQRRAYERARAALARLLDEVRS